MVALRGSVRPNFKKPDFRSKKYREAGRDFDCVFCPGKPVHSGAHLPHHAVGFPGGKAYKCPDWLLADLCIDCHEKMDGEEWRNDHQMRMKALCLTIERRYHQGVIVIPGEDHVWGLVGV